MKAVYLKINQDIPSLIPSVKSWLEIFLTKGNNKIFFICDKPELKSKIESTFNLSGLNIEWIKSSRNDSELRYIVERLIIPHWRNAAYAHLTAFLHSRDNGFTEFWNIDADDLRFFLFPEKAAEVLNTIEQVANDNQIEIFALDVYYSVYFSCNWSLGNAYVKNDVDWIQVLKNLVDDEEFCKLFDSQMHPKNVDALFGAIRMIDTPFKIESYAVENLHFVHEQFDVYSDVRSGLMYLKDGQYHHSVLDNYTDFGFKDYAPLNSEVYKIDIGLTDNDFYQYFKQQLKNDLLDNFRIISEAKKLSQDNQPEISVVINAEGSKSTEVIYCLANLTQQTFKNFELIFQTTDKYKSMIAGQMSKFFPYGIQVLRGGGESLICKGKLIVNIDSSEILPYDYLSNVIEEFNNENRLFESESYIRLFTAMR